MYDPCVIFCVPNKTKDVNLEVFKMIKLIKESKLPAKHILSDCKFKFDVKKPSLNKK